MYYDTSETQFCIFELVFPFCPIDFSNKNETSEWFKLKIDNNVKKSLCSVFKQEVESGRDILLIPQLTKSCVYLRHTPTVLSSWFSGSFSIYGIVIVLSIYRGGCAMRIWMALVFL